jgi:hypothetical protein
LRREPSFIRIVSVPPGEAPLWVREKWVGLELPLADNTRRPRDYYGFGVLSAPRTRNWLVIWWWALRGRGGLERHTGYAVNADEAVRRLEITAPNAAAWWRETVPHLLGPRQKFVFAESVCQIVKNARDG